MRRRRTHTLLEHRKLHPQLLFPTNGFGPYTMPERLSECILQLDALPGEGIVFSA